MSRSQHDQMRPRILCFRDMSSIYGCIFAKLLSLVHLGTQNNLIMFLGQKVKVQGHTIAVEAHSTRRYRRVQLFLVMYLYFWRIK